MNIKRVAATLGAALAIAGAPALAWAGDVQAGPIQIENVQIYDQVLSYEQNSRLPVSAAISFKNQYAAPATDVVFVLQSDGVAIAQFHDVGSFAKGVTIKHRFPDNRDGDGADVRVAVAWASFADGTVWKSSDVVAWPEPARSIGVRVTRMF